MVKSVRLANCKFDCHILKFILDNILGYDQGAGDIDLTEDEEGWEDDTTAS